MQGGDLPNCWITTLRWYYIPLLYNEGVVIMLSKTEMEIIYQEKRDQYRKANRAAYAGNPKAAFRRDYLEAQIDLLTFILEVE